MISEVLQGRHRHFKLMLFCIKSAVFRIADEDCKRSRDSPTIGPLDF